MPEISKKLCALLSLIRWDKPYGTLLLLAPAFWSLFIAAKGTPPFHLIVIFTLGAFLMRSAGCAINDWADHPLDANVERTRSRPLPSGQLTPPQALAVFLVLAIMAFFLLWWLNPLTRLLSLVAVLLAVTYPFTKRFLKIPQLFMGVAFGWGSVMAWTAVRNAFELPTLFLFLAVVFWATAYDTIYALMDREEDARAGIYSSALLFGGRNSLAVGILFGLSVFFLTLLGIYSNLGIPYYGSLAIVGSCFLYQSLALRNKPDRSRLFLFFKSHAGIGFVLLIGILVGYYIP